MTMRAVRPHVWDGVEFSESRKRVKVAKEPTSFVVRSSEFHDGVPEGHLRWSTNSVRREEVLLRAFVRERGGYLINVTKYEVKQNPSVKDKETMSLYKVAQAWRWLHMVGGVGGLALAIAYMWI